MTTSTSEPVRVILPDPLAPLVGLSPEQLDAFAAWLIAGRGDAPGGKRAFALGMVAVALWREGEADLELPVRRQVAGGDRAVPTPLGPLVEDWQSDERPLRVTDAHGLRRPITAEPGEQLAEIQSLQWPADMALTALERRTLDDLGRGDEASDFLLAIAQERGLATVAHCDAGAGRWTRPEVVGVDVRPPPSLADGSWPTGVGADRLEVREGRVLGVLSGGNYRRHPLPDSRFTAAATLAARDSSLSYEARVQIVPARSPSVVEAARRLDRAEAAGVGEPAARGALAEELRQEEGRHGLESDDHPIAVLEEIVADLSASYLTVAAPGEIDELAELAGEWRLCKPHDEGYRLCDPVFDPAEGRPPYHWSLYGGPTRQRHRVVKCGGAYYAQPV